MELNNRRPRRNRKSANLRELVQEHNLKSSDLIAPLFLIEEKGSQIEIDSMPGIYRFGPDVLIEEAKKLYDLGIPCVSIFPALKDDQKDKIASESYRKDHFLPETIAAIKKEIPGLLVMSDVAMDPYSSDGHDGLVDESGEILNDESLDILAKMAITQAQAGSDIIGPSDMMDGRVGYLRQALDESGFKNTTIMSYTAKYASAFYGPFRDALDSAPKKGDKKTYQMNPSNRREALLEMELDIKEGADILMVKPGICYLDIIREMKDRCHLPIAAYNVSGEYAMVKAADQKGWLNGEATMTEMLISFKRAGADMILSYFSKEMATLLKEK